MRVQSKSHDVPVEYCEWLGEYYIKFPEELMTDLDWEEGDTITWELLDNKTVIVKRKAEN
jgi:hypothetical protein